MPDGAGQGLRLMKFEDRLRAQPVDGVLGQPGRRRRYWASRSAPSGASGIALRRKARRVSHDRRLGRLSARRAPVDEVARVLEAGRHPLWDIHRQALPREAGGRSRLRQLQLSRWLTLQAYGRRRAAPRRVRAPAQGPRRAPRIAHRGRGLRGTAGARVTSRHSSTRLLENSPMSSRVWMVQSSPSAMSNQAPCRLSRSRFSRPMGRDASREGPHSEARGRSERMFGTLQKRLPQELRLAGITGIDRFLKDRMAYRGAFESGLLLRIRQPGAAAAISSAAGRSSFIHLPMKSPGDRGSAAGSRGMLCEYRRSARGQESSTTMCRTLRLCTALTRARQRCRGRRRPAHARQTRAAPGWRHCGRRKSRPARHRKWFPAPTGNRSRR